MKLGHRYWMEDGTKILNSLGSKFSVQQFSDYHFRVNGHLDLWVTTKKFYDLKSHRKGQYDDLADFLDLYFTESKNTKVCAGFVYSSSALDVEEN
jgi:hypothetical protein